jgi:hypothetical protein
LATGFSVAITWNLLVLVTMYPEFRDHEFFVVNDDIIVVDNSRRIIGIVPAGEQVVMAPAPRGTAAAAGPLNLSVDEIREVQTALKSQGFEVVVDGQMGPRTMAALTQFQRRQGLQATGKIDSQTVAALGVNVKGAQGQPSTTGQNPPTGSQPSAKPPTSSTPAPQPPANPTGREGMRGKGPPSTTGRSDGKMGTSPRPQAPAGTPSEPIDSKHTGLVGANWPRLRAELFFSSSLDRIAHVAVSACRMTSASRSPTNDCAGCNFHAQRRQEPSPRNRVGIPHRDCSRLSGSDPTRHRQEQARGSSVR